MSAYDSLLLRLIDKTNSTPTGITEGGLIAGDISPYHVRSELLHSIVNRTSNVTIMLYVPPSGIFVTAAPKLLDDDAQDKYYLEAQIEQGGVFTRVFRMRIGQPTLIQEDNTGANMIKIPVVGIEYIAKEWPTSKQDKLLSPKQRFINLLTEFNSNGGIDNPKLNHAVIDIDLPSNEPSRQNWNSFAPRMLDKAFKEIIDRQVEPGAVAGTFTDKFVDYIPTPTITKQVDVKVQDFGGVSSGITINAETISVPSTPEKKTGISDQLARKNAVIYKYHPAGASMPMEKTRFESNLNHAKLRPEWSASATYAIGDLVKFTHTSETPNVIRYFKAKNAVGPSATTPDADAVDWIEDFTIIPPHSTDAFYTSGSIVTVINGANTEHYKANADVGPAAAPPNASWTKVFTSKLNTLYTAFVTNSPWTNDLDAVKKSCLVGQNNIPTGDNGIVYVGAVPDWNAEAALYDRVDYTNDFKHVSGRNCRDQLNAPPTGRNLFHGSRYLVGAAPTGAFAGNANKIATYNRLPIEDVSNPQWLFSDAPAEGDTIMLDDMAQVLAFQSGAWVVKHNIDTNNDRSGPYHLCSGIRLVEDKSGIPGQAVELNFNWNLAVQTGDDNNRSSRGFWYHEEYPLPTRDSANFNIGALYGGGGTTFPPLPFMNSINLDQNRQGLVGWNRGLDAEDHGRLGVHVIAINVGFYRSTDDTILTKGKANIPVIYYRKDLFGRVYYHEFTVPRNAEWWIERVPIPPLAPPTQLYHNRLNELASILGYTIPTVFGLPEKEFSGVRFDERFAKSWGVMHKESYSREGFYIGTYDFVAKSFIESAQQLIPDILELIDKIAHADWDNIAFTEAQGTTHHVKLKIGNLYYEKEGYAMSEDAMIDEPRFIIKRDEAETDYLNAKLKAKALRIRKFELLNEWYFTTAGDVRMEAGKSFILDGPNIPGPITMVCQEVKHIIDNDQGYNMEVYAIRKRPVPI